MAATSAQEAEQPGLGVASGGATRKFDDAEVVAGTDTVEDPLVHRGHQLAMPVHHTFATWMLVFTFVHPDRDTPAFAVVGTESTATVSANTITTTKPLRLRACPATKFTAPASTTPPSRRYPSQGVVSVPQPKAHRTPASRTPPASTEPAIWRVRQRAGPCFGRRPVRTRDQPLDAA